MEKKNGRKDNLSRRAYLRLHLTAGAAAYASGLPHAFGQAATKTIRFGLIGQDGHQSIILDSLPRHPEIRWVATATSRPGDDITYIKKHPAAHAQMQIYENYDEMLEKADLDLVVICLPYAWNAPAAIKAGKLGIHVISDKPAATTLSDLDELESVFLSGRPRYSSLLNMRALPNFLAARQAVKEGKIGEPILISSQKSYKFGKERPWFYKDRKIYGGTIPWIGIHAIDFMRWVSGQEYSAVAAVHGNKAHPDYPGCQDYASVLFRLKNGGTAISHQDYLRPASAPTHGDDRLRVAGTDGVLEVLENEGKVTLFSGNGQTGALALPPPIDLLDDFLSSLQGKKEPLIPTSEIFSITRVCLKAQEAADCGRWLNL
jgi:predicted dehydrogenase